MLKAIFNAELLSHESVNDVRSTSHDAHIGPPLVVVSSVLIGVAAAAVILRVISRVWVMKTYGIDDWFVMGSVLTSFGLLASIILGVKHGIGRHSSNESTNHAVLGKIQLAIQVLYILTSGLVKLSILFLYKRIFPKLRIATIILAVLVTLLTITFIFVAIFQCRPVGSYWVQSNSSCISLLIYWCDVAVAFLISNIIIVGLPFKFIIDLSLPKRKKVMTLLLLCSAGFCTVVAAAVRLAYVVHLYKDGELTWNIVPIYICSVVEISSALVASSIPSLRLAYLSCNNSRTEKAKRSQGS